MQYPVADIVEQVKIILDQNQQENPIIVQEDNTLELNTIIRQKILHAARLLLETSDVSVLGEGVSNPVIKIDENDEEIIPTDWEDYDISNPIHIGEMGDGYGELSAWWLEMPEKYLRLLSLRMSDWKRAVHVTIPFESAEYSQLRSGFVGITGNPERPAVAEAKHSTISRVEGNHPVLFAETERHLEIYTSATGDVVDFRYIKIPEYYTPTGETTEYLDFPEKLYRHLLYQTGSFVAATYKDSGLAQLLMNMVYEGEPESKEEQ